MREIKFRAWDTRKDKMYSAEEMGQDELTINPDGRGFVNVSGTDQRLSQYMHHITPMQFTGLLDKQGKEIYEGDIVRFIDHINNTEVGEVQYGKQNGAFCFFLPHIGTGIRTPILNFISGTLCTIATIADNNFEIIGNIYEHPHLLEAQ